MKVGDVYCTQIKGYNGVHWGEIVEVDGRLFFKIWDPAHVELRGKTFPVKEYNRD